MSFIPDADAQRFFTQLAATTREPFTPVDSLEASLTFDLPPSPPPERHLPFSATQVDSDLGERADIHPILRQQSLESAESEVHHLSITLLPKKGLWADKLFKPSDVAGILTLSAVSEHILLPTFDITIPPFAINSLSQGKPVTIFNCSFHHKKENLNTFMLDLQLCNQKDSMQFRSHFFIREFCQLNRSSNVTSFGLSLGYNEQIRRIFTAAGISSKQCEQWEKNESYNKYSTL